MNCKKVLERCCYVSLRDEPSRLLLLRMGVDAARLHLGADTALFLPPPPRGRELALLHRAGIRIEHHFLAVILRSMEEDSFLFRTLSGAIRTICQRNGWTPLFLCMDEQHDASIARLAAKRLQGIYLPAQEVTDISALLRASEMAISLRLHGMILAGTVGTLTLGICCEEKEQKLRAFGKRACLPVLSPDGLTVGKIVNTVEEMHASAPQIRLMMQESLTEQRKNARKDLENILRMLYNRSSNAKNGNGSISEP